MVHQNYGKGIGFNCIVSKEVNVAALILCDQKT